MLLKAQEYNNWTLRKACKNEQGNSEATKPSEVKEPDYSLVVASLSDNCCIIVQSFTPVWDVSLWNTVIVYMTNCQCALTGSSVAAIFVL